MPLMLECFDVLIVLFLLLFLNLTVHFIFLSGKLFEHSFSLSMLFSFFKLSNVFFLNIFKWPSFALETMVYTHSQVSLSHLTAQSHIYQEVLGPSENFMITLSILESFRNLSRTRVFNNQFLQNCYFEILELCDSNSNVKPFWRNVYLSLIANITEIQISYPHNCLERLNICGCAFSVSIMAKNVQLCV